MKLLLGLFLSLGLISGIPQISCSQNQILGSGGDISDSGGSISFSLGQLGYNSLSGNGFSQIEGVQQPKEISVLVSVGLEEEGIEIYPNPAKNYLKISFPKVGLDRHISLYSIKGKKLIEEKVIEPESILNLTELSPGLYFLLIRKADRVLHAHQIIIE